MAVALYFRVAEGFRVFQQCVQADVEQLKDVAVALETKLPVHEKRVVQLKAAKREIKSKVARKRKEYKQLLAELKRLKPQEKASRTFVLESMEEYDSCFTFYTTVILHANNEATKLE